MDSAILLNQMMKQIYAVLIEAVIKRVKRA